MNSTFNSPVIEVDCQEWQDVVETMPIHRMTASEVTAAMELVECLRLHALKIASGGFETPNDGNNWLAEGAACSKSS